MWAYQPGLKLRFVVLAHLVREDGKGLSKQYTK